MTRPRELGPIDLLVGERRIAVTGRRGVGAAAADWWHVLEVTCSARTSRAAPSIPGMLERGRGRIVLTGTEPHTRPGLDEGTRVSGEQGGPRAASARSSPRSSRGTASRLLFSPGLVRTDMTGRRSATTPRGPRRTRAAPRSRARVRRADAFTGRYLHAEHDDIEDLIAPRGRGPGERPERDPAPSLTALTLGQRRPAYPPASAVLHLSQLQAIGPSTPTATRVHDPDGPVPELRVRLPLRNPRGLLPGPGDGDSSSATAEDACSPSGAACSS